MTLLDTALALTTHGCSVIPVRTDGTKTPAIAWKTYQTQAPSLDQVTAWFTGNQFDGLGVITGTVSGGLEMLEIEGRALQLLTELATLFTDNGRGDLWQRLCTGYMERSPSGGIHWLYRIQDAPARGNTKLARKPQPEGKGVDVLIETRGEGGYVVVAPSGGRTHPTGEPWTMIAGSPDTIPVISEDDRDFIYAICSLLDQMPAVENMPADIPASSASTGSGTRPGDDYNQRASWDDILGARGWTKTKSFGSRGYGWTRPDKAARDGISATTGTSGDGADRLYVFSSSTEFDTERPYSKFAAYTLLEHNGDYAAAARALAKAGYGTPPPEPPRPTPGTTVVAGIPIADHGNTAPAAAPAAEPHAQVHISEPTTYSPTDDGNALRLIDTHHANIRYCPEAGSWLTWNGHKWAWDTAGHIHELARTIARDLPTDDKDATTHRRKSLSNIGLKGMVSVARTDHRIIVTPNQLDGRPYELNTPDGVINLRTGELRPPDPAALHTRSTTVTPDPTAPAPRWHKFLADTFAGDPELTTYVQRVLGLSLIGEHLEQILPFQTGAGANGKSTLMNVAQGLVGTGQEGYSIPAPAELLLASHNRSHPTELARLSGARLVVASELEDGERFAESRIKMLTGGENIAARFMGKDFFSFKPTHTIWLLANEQPAVRAGGPAFWRRLRLIEFLHVVPAEDRIAGLDHILIDEEGPAILAWLIQGAVDYLAHGLAEPASVRVATSAYEKDQDTVARFVEEACDRGPVAAQHMRVRVAELRSAYENWCRQEGETPVSAKALTTALTTRFGVISERSNSSRFYAGIRLTDVSPEPGEASLEEPDSWWNK